MISRLAEITTTASFDTQGTVSFSWALAWDEPPRRVQAAGVTARGAKYGVYFESIRFSDSGPISASPSLRRKQCHSLTSQFLKFAS